MRPVIVGLAALALAAPAAGQREPEWRSAPEAQILLRPFAFEPALIRLEAGRPVKLHFVNNSRATLSVSAPAFFRAARIRGREARSVADGHFRVAPGERRIVALVPAPGRYRLRSFNALHRLLGMSAEILVE
jgi:plastocyanin